MNTQVEKLYQLAAKKSRTIIGLMSGTSLDGLDIALCKIQGSGTKTKVELLEFETVPYPLELKEEIRKIFAKPTIDFELLTLLNPKIAVLHAHWINKCLDQWKIDRSNVDLIASHGQTVYHTPKILHQKENYGNATLQIGDGDHMAVETGIITISDFRQKHIAAGGEGAPLALYGDYCIFSDESEDRIMLNMGGIANFTFLPADRDTKKVFVTDTGPGNTLIDAYVQKHFNCEYDKDAFIAKNGNVNESLLSALKVNDFFSAPIPKTTGPELFNLKYLENAIVQSSTVNISKEDILATLTKFSADTIADALEKIVQPKGIYKIYMSGGGAHNPLLTEHIQKRFPTIQLASTNDLGINGDAKEAILFAILANETVAGNGIDFGRKEMPSVTMGKISFPS
jgi:anhydro-N-acetylmuramic acid kinase